MPRPVVTLLCVVALSGLVAGNATGALARGKHPAPRPIINFQGSDSKHVVHRSWSFHTPRTWTLHWLFNCIDNPGRPGPFSVALLDSKHVHKAAAMLTIQVGAGDHGSLQEHRQGLYRLQVVTPCYYSVQVTR